MTEHSRQATAARRSLALTVALVVVPISIASAAEPPTRDGYVTELEAICKPRAQATQRAMKGARADVSAERLGEAAVKFGKASRIFGSTVGKIAAVPRPPADRPKLRKWFAYLNQQKAYLSEITAELRADHAVKAQRLTARFIHNGNLANNAVLEFGFNHCSFKFSRYG